RALSAVPRHLAVDDDRAIAARMLHTTPFAAGKIVRDIADPIRLDPEPSEIVDDDVCRQPFAQNAAVAEAGRMRGQGGEAIVRLFERDTLFVANQPSKKIGRVRAAGEELGM